MHLTSTLPFAPSATSGTIDLEAKDKGGTNSNFRDGHQRWLGGKILPGARAAVWTETEEKAHDSGKGFTETGIMATTEISAKAGAKWTPGNTEPSMSRDLAAWLEHQQRQAQGTGQGEYPAASSVSSILAETVAPILTKPLGLLSKAVWTRSFSSSLSKTSTPTTKASALRPFSSPATANNKDTQAASNISLVYVNSNSSASNSSSHWGKKMCSLVI